MHKSRLAGFIIDCETNDLDDAATFWSAALGWPTNVQPADVGTAYVPLKTRALTPAVEVQKVSHPSRVHLDIESDDIEAEVKRLEALGAKVDERKERWVVMLAPTGQRFCVIRAKSADFEAAANRW